MLDLMKWPVEREIMVGKGKTGGVDSKAEEIRDFDENLAAIIQKAIGNMEEVGVEVLGRLERSEIWVGKDCRILADEAKREFTSELVVPFRANDVIVEDAGTLVEAAKAGEQVGVVHGEFSRGAHGKIDLRIAGVCEDRRAKRGVEVGVRAPAKLSV